MKSNANCSAGTLNKHFKKTRQQFPKSNKMKIRTESRACESESKRIWKSVQNQIHCNRGQTRLFLFNLKE